MIPSFGQRSLFEITKIHMDHLCFLKKYSTDMIFTVILSESGKNGTLQWRIRDLVWNIAFI